MEYTSVSASFVNVHGFTMPTQARARA